MKENELYVIYPEENAPSWQKPKGCCLNLDCRHDLFRIFWKDSE